MACEKINKFVNVLSIWEETVNRGASAPGTVFSDEAKMSEATDERTYCGFYSISRRKEAPVFCVWHDRAAAASQHGAGLSRP